MGKQKTFLENADKGYSVDTLTIIQDTYGDISFKSSLFRGSCYLSFSKAKIKSIIKFLETLIE